MTLVPDACALPVAEQPLRVAELASLVSTATSYDRVSATRAILRLPAAPGLADEVNDLVARETRCCPFFDFRAVETEAGIELVVDVPPAQAEVLDGLIGRPGATPSV